MPKKCIICEQNARYSIKGTSDYYCQECAIENFGDTAFLVEVEEQAKKLKKLIDELDIEEKKEIGENQYLPDNN